MAKFEYRPIFRQTDDPALKQTQEVIARICKELRDILRDLDEDNLSPELRMRLDSIESDAKKEEIGQVKGVSANAYVDNTGLLKRIIE